MQHRTDLQAASIQPPPLLGETAETLLARWLQLGELERRAFLAMTRELTASSALVENSVIDLSARFQALAETAGAQVGRVEAIIATAQSLPVSGAEMRITEATQFIEGVLGTVIDTVLTMSQNAARMVHALEEVARDVAGAEKCVAQIHAINRQTRFLALNAAIEARRAGASGAAFEVIAHEIKELSKATDRTATDVSTRIGSVASGVRRGHAVLQEIATIDMAGHRAARDRLDAILLGLVEQNHRFTDILATAMDASTELSATIAPLVVGLQFQDRVSQHLAHVTDALDALRGATESLQTTTHAALPDRYEAGEIDTEWLDHIINRQTLGAVRRRFLAQLLTGVASMEEEKEEADIELF